ncbi:MFS transporter [Asanoa ishikariensis]|uniref:MFS transporter, DHA2 family, multidrug resistance protein n=1 Tax=Asanoa ishikariensis TaxID=137265 RepID=A0A1H3TR40_9ACTN|nr:MFS transporter [Asanoa ishikariensis]GIF61978.1 MFS transporter [Asanoa ishikariensis]SDZ52487.1 MFS transporter, DHA2 family, multidrug resistance protein [Asanoa ishikariensis]
MDVNDSRAGRKEWVGLAVLALPSLLVSIDLFVLLLAVPQLSGDLGAGSTDQLWIIDVYGFLLSGFLITMGALGDRLGRRRLLLGGAAVFGVASVLAAYADSPAMLIAARALLGVAGAAMGPTTLALITGMFRDPKQRATAIGVWLMSLMGGSAIGPVVGGILLGHFWWGSVFLIAVPAMLLLLVLGPILLPKDRPRRDPAPLDLASVALSLAAILPAVYGIKELARHGVQPTPAAALIVGLLFAAAFLRRQRTLTDPLVDLRLFGERTFRTALGAMLVNTMLPGTVMVLITQFLQLVAGYQPLRAGLALLPAVAAGLLATQVAPLAARRIRPAPLIAGGLAVSFVGLVLLTSASDATTVITGMALFNVGAGPLVTLGTGIVVGAVPPERAGSAASLSQTANEFGFALGVAVFGSVAAAVYRHGAPAGAGDSLAATPPALLDQARAAFTDGLHVVAAISAVAIAVTAVLCLRALRHLSPVGQDQAKEEEARLPEHA